MTHFPFKKQANNTASDSSTEPDLLAEDILRAEMVPGSKLYPDQSWRGRIIQPGRLYAVLVILGILGVGWICFAGPGVPLLERFLTKMAVRAFTNQPSTPTVISTHALETQAATVTLHPTAVARPSVTAKYTQLPSASPSFTPTRVKTTAPTPTITAISNTATPSPAILTSTQATEVQGCVAALSVKLDDVGKTLCVTGKVLRTDQKANSFLIILENPKEAFYFLSYDRVWNDLRPGECVFATGKIMQLGDNPVMVLSYRVPLEYCP